MPIAVTCPSCLKRFNVGDQHAGKTGPCPKCKKPIKIPELGDEIVIHAPELEAGAKNAAGKNVLKPIKRKQAKFSMNITAIVIGLLVLSIGIAWWVGQMGLSDGNLFWTLTGGGLLVGPLVAYAGYTFLRDDELGVYAGNAVVIRSLSCGAVYILLWGVYCYLGTQIFGTDEFNAGLEMAQICMIGVPVLGMGAFAAFACFDLEMLTGFFHYMLYVLITIGLRFVMDLPFIPGMGE